jgi:hypothetical protein
VLRDADSGERRAAVLSEGKKAPEGANQELLQISVLGASGIESLGSRRVLASEAGGSDANRNCMDYSTAV